MRRGATALLACALAVCCGGEPDPPAPSFGAPSPGGPPGGLGDAAARPPEGPPPGPGWFTDVTAAAGVTFVHDAGLLPEKHLPETMAPGAALADLDGDGRLDLYLVQSGPMPVPGVDRVGAPRNALYLADPSGGLLFRDASGDSGAAADDGYGMGVAVGDIDGDDDLDLLVTNLGPDVLLSNDGAAGFRDVTAASGYDDDRWTGSAAFFDADGDGDLDLFVAAYVLVDLSEPMWCGRRDPGWRSACHPDAYPGLADRYWRNDGGGRFVDATAESGFDAGGEAPGKGLGVLPLDVDDDGDLDLYVANDSVENRLWANVGGGRFEDATLLSGTGVSGRGMTEAGMGLAGGDVDGDGDLDLFVTNFDDESNTLYRNDGGGFFTDVTDRAGLDASSRLPVGFGTVMSDLDDDGDLDIAVTNGHIIDNIALYHDGKTHAQDALLFRNRGDGRFDDVSSEAGALTAGPRVGRGLYDGDLDGDGDRDLLLTTCGGPTVVLRNERGGRSVTLRGLPWGSRIAATRSDGIVIQRQAGPAPSYFGQCAPEVHVGLDTASLQAVTLTDTLGRARPLKLDAALGPGVYNLLPDGSLGTPLPAPTSR